MRQTQAPGRSVQTFVEGAAAHQVIALKVREGAAYAGQQQPFVAQRPGILGIEVMRGGLSAITWQHGRSIGPVAQRGLVHADGRAARIVVACKVEPGAAYLPARYYFVCTGLDGSFQPIAGLGQIVGQLQIVTQRDLLLAGVVAIGFDVAPVAICLEMVELVAHAQPVVDLVLGTGAHALVLDADIAVGGVEVASQQLGHDGTVHGGRAEIACRFFVADIGQQFHAQGRRRLPAQRAHQLAAAGAAHVVLAICVVAIGIQAVAQRVAQRAAHAQTELGRTVRAGSDQYFAHRLLAGLLAHHIGRGAHGTRAIDDGGRAAQHFHALIAPAVGGVGGGAGRHAQAYAVFGNANRIGAGEAARTKGQAAVAGGGQRRHAHRAPDDFSHTAVTALLPGLLVHIVEAGGQVAGGDAGPAARCCWPRQTQSARGGVRDLYGG